MKQKTNKDTSFLKPLLIALPIISAIGVASYLYIDKQTVDPVEVPNTKAPEKSIIENQTPNRTSQVVSLYPKVVIPNKPGNIKELITILAKKSGYEVDWKLKGYYNLNAEEIPQWNNPIALILTPLTDVMTLNNKELMVKWHLGNPGERFPYPVNVMTLLCGKTLMFFELEVPAQISTLLERSDFKHCTIPNASMGDPLTNMDMSQFDFSQPPPFLKPYDPTAPQPKAGVNEKINEIKIDPKFINQNTAVPTLKWTMPEDQKPIDVKHGEELKPNPNPNPNN